MLLARTPRRPLVPPPDRRSRTVLLLLILAAALSSAACGSPTTESGEATLTPLGHLAVVERVVDGDTIVVSIDGRTETVRLLGIDTPEKPGGPRPAECFGADASAHAEALVPPGTVVRLSRDRESRDQYARLLAFVHRADDGLFVNLAMLEGGYASPLFFAPNTALESRFEAAGNAARRNWVGFWPACGAADVALP